MRCWRIHRGKGTLIEHSETVPAETRTLYRVLSTQKVRNKIMTAKLSKPENMEKWVYAYEMPFVKQILKNPGEVLGYDSNDKNAWFIDNVEIIKNMFAADNVITASAELAKNERAQDMLCCDSGNFDIWFDVLMAAWLPERGCYGYIKAAAYLTDVQRLTPDNRDETMKHMYIRKFAEVQ